jgi:hypothetical protein
MTRRISRLLSGLLVLGTLAIANASTVAAGFRHP